MMVGMEDDQKPKRKWATYAATILFLLFLYPLSLGPAIGLSTKYPKLNDIVFTAYFPLIIIVYKTGAGEPVSAYVNWCVGIIDPENETVYDFN
jgi:hypothetical protein